MISIIVVSSDFRDRVFSTKLLLHTYFGHDDVIIVITLNVA